MKQSATSSAFICTQASVCKVLPVLFVLNDPLPNQPTHLFDVGAPSMLTEQIPQSAYVQSALL